MGTTSTSETHFKLQGRALLLARFIWVALVVVTVAIYILAVPIAYESNLHRYPEALLRPFGLSPSLIAVYRFSLFTIFYLVYVTVGLLIFLRRANDWLAFLGSLVLATYPFTFSNAPFLLTMHPVLWSLVMILSYFLEGLLLIVIFLFPDGRFVPRWTRWLALGVGLWSLVLCLFPVGPDPSTSPPIFDTLYIAGTILWFGAGVLIQIYRYRHVASTTQRQQTKWVVFSLAAVFLGWLAYDLPFVFIPSLSQPGLPHFLWSYLVFSIFVGILLLVPVCLSFAILRYRLWDIDFLINRSLVYGTLTVLLAALFAVSLYLISQLMRDFAGGPLVAVAASASVFGAIFQPARRRLQRFVDQRFYNIQIDYQKTPPPVPLPSGLTQVFKQTLFGTYQNLELIGRGGMAEVYQSTHPTLGVPVAIKLLPPAFAADPDFRRRFTREAQVVAKLEHPNIVRVFDYGEQDGTHYMVMEYLAGKDLANFLKVNGRLSLSDALPLIHGIASALDYAHQHGVVHRDVKPSNVMLEIKQEAGGTEDRFARRRTETSASVLLPLRAVLTDFGIAKILAGETALTRTGMLGTFDYIAPEQIQASAEVDGRADVYALGVMVYQMLTGELPFKHNHPGALLMAHMTQPPPDPREIVPNLPADAAYAIRRAMAKSPHERYATAGEFAGALSRNEN